MSNVTDYSDLSQNALIELLDTPNLSKTKQLKATKALQNLLRDQSLKLKKDLDQEREGTIAEQKALRDTKVKMVSYRKTMQDAYRVMNKIITTKSLLNNLGEFETATSSYFKETESFCDAIEEHIANLKVVKDKQ